MSFWSDLDWFCCSVLTLRQNSKTSPKRFKTTPKFVTFKLLIYSNVPKCILVPLQVSTCWGLIPRGGTPYNGLYGEAPPEMGTFLRLQGQGYERVGISLVEVYERVGRSVISVGKKRVQKGHAFCGCENFLVLWFIHLHFKESAITAVKAMQSSKLGIWKGYLKSIESIQKGYIFCQRYYIGR